MRVGRWIWVALAALGVAIGVPGFWLVPASLKVRAVDLPLAWPRAEPLRVAVISDLHVGSPYYGLSRLPEIVDSINAAQPDVVCILGDFVTLGVIGGHRVPPEPIAEGLRGLHSRLGTYAVLGNHDRKFNGPEVQSALEAAGIHVLEDTAVMVQAPGGPLWLAGVSDAWTGAHNVRRALADVPDNGSPLIVLTHNPDIFPVIPPRALLTLAGHTHGGQVRLPLIGAPIVPSEYGPRYVAGEVIEGGRHLFVSTGLGTSDIPIRLGVPPTIFILTIRRASN